MSINLLIPSLAIYCSSSRFFSGIVVAFTIFMVQQNISRPQKHEKEKTMKNINKTKIQKIGVAMVMGIIMIALSIPLLQAAGLNDIEKNYLLLMREEEKLARDVYQALNAKWNHRTFTNIAKSEQQHMDSLKVLLDRYGIPDPTAGKKPGEFTNQKLQGLYAELVKKGSASLSAALAVGVEVEKLDIADLEEAISKTTQNDINVVYKNLLRGSNNHLKAFSSQPGGNGRGATR